MSAKQQFAEVIASVPESASLEEVFAQLYRAFKEKIRHQAQDRSAISLPDIDEETASLATSGANSGANSESPVVRALGQLSETMIILVGVNELGYARAIYEAIGRILSARSACIR